MQVPLAWWIGEMTLNPLGFSLPWFKPCSDCMLEGQVLLMDGQVVFPRVLRFSPTFDERWLDISEIFLKGQNNPNPKKKKKKKKKTQGSNVRPLWSGERYRVSWPSCLNLSIKMYVMGTH